MRMAWSGNPSGSAGGGAVAAVPSAAVVTWAPACVNVFVDAAIVYL